MAYEWATQLLGLRVVPDDQRWSDDVNVLAAAS